jgi:hypothetical protein
MKGDELDEVDHKGYHPGIGKLLYLSRWSRPEILNITQDLSRQFIKDNQAHLKLMKNVMTFCVDIKEHGITINLTGNWNDKVDQDYFFEIIGVLESGYVLLND